MHFRSSEYDVKQGPSDSSTNGTPTSADTPSDSTEQSVGAVTAGKSSDSFTVEFVEDSTEQSAGAVTAGKSSNSFIVESEDSTER